MNRWTIGNSSLLMTLNASPLHGGTFAFLELIERHPDDQGVPAGDPDAGVARARKAGMDCVKIGFADVGALDHFISQMGRLRADMVAAEEAATAMAEDPAPVSDLDDYKPGDAVLADPPVVPAMTADGGPLDNP